MPHDHPHAPHPIRKDDPEPATYHQFLGLAISELLIEKGLFTRDEEREMIAWIEGVDATVGARVVARAWLDPDFKAGLLKDAAPLLNDMGLDTPYQIVVVENTPEVHNVVVCTLCSCYPRRLLGRPPSWYKSKPYRARTVKEPRKVLSEFGTEISQDREVRVHDSTAEMRYLVLPLRPQGTDDWSEEALAKLVTRDAMIGVAELASPKT